ncbi:alginate export family protein [Luteibacter sp. CQ10]|uniref:alginate export family protein n=1 Tax=Luteibacter sp. CQ10 TaxID=2805821 RepID=UPI0034A4ADCF
MKRIGLPLVAAFFLAATVSAQDVPDEKATTNDGLVKTPDRPAILPNRWQEDWSVLADPAVPRQPGDALKYMPLGPGGDHYLTFGALLRERVETNNAPAFGIGRDDDTYLLQRFQVHAGLRWGTPWLAFVQLEDARPFAKASWGPTDRNHADVRLAFLAWQGDLLGGTVRARVGRQDFALDLQRFVSLRDGPNVRQSFDALWANFERGPWRVIAFLSHPVQYRDDHAFDDTSGSGNRFHMVRVERHVLGTNELSYYHAWYDSDDARFLDAHGNERRHVDDVRFAGKSGPLDWDLEAMRQRGRVGDSAIHAWAVGTRVGWTLTDTAWTPRLGVQVDTASGDGRPGDGRLGTFNPLFPNGYYFSLAGYTGYANLVHVKPSITLKPASTLTLLGAVGLQWRRTTNDAIYVQPNNALAGTAGHGGTWTGMYGQLRLDWKWRPGITFSIEGDHFRAGRTIRDAGGTDGNYGSVQVLIGW